MDTFRSNGGDSRDDREYNAYKMEAHFWENAALACRKAAQAVTDTYRLADDTAQSKGLQW